jgi:hypothetical protein
MFFLGAREGPQRSGRRKNSDHQQALSSRNYHCITFHEFLWHGFHWRNPSTYTPGRHMHKIARAK